MLADGGLTTRQRRAVAALLAAFPAPPTDAQFWGVLFALQAVLDEASLLRPEAQMVVQGLQMHLEGRS